MPVNRYEFHENRCFDWGTVGWALRSGKVDITGYKYFIIMNSSVRGPFTPAYFSDKHHWSRIFTDRITDEVKLVGPTISCEGAPLEGDASKEWRTNPHVQSYVTATDQTGMAILQVPFCAFVTPLLVQMAIAMPLRARDVDLVVEACPHMRIWRAAYLAMSDQILNLLHLPCCMR